MLSRDDFVNPPNSCRPMPFWFWNSRLREDEIERQVRDFADKGIGGFFIHARFGLETPYMSQEWMGCIRRAAAAAAELGMEVWLYDENGFPSGVGDLRVSRIREYRSQFIDLTERTAAAGEIVALDLPPGDVLTACAFPDGQFSRRIDLTGAIDNSRLLWTAPEGSEWSIAVFSRRVLEDANDVVFGVDYLNPDAMQYFFDLTLEPYAEALGEYFGNTIKGIFTDEPTLLPWHHDINWYGRRAHTRVVVWDDRIEREMAAATGRSAAEFLPHLFNDLDESTTAVRRAFWTTVSRLYLDAFFRPYSQWCEKHNLKLTGHVLFEEGLYLNTDFQADISQILPLFAVPGADHLGEGTENPYGGFANTVRHLTNLQGQKLVSSIAHCAGRNVVLSETYGCAGWGLSFERMKWIADWQYSLGINLLCPHAVFYSIEGFRKSDAPPSENSMAGWQHYRGFADYIGRLSYLLRQGRHVARVALLYPLQEFWEKHKVGAVGEADRVVSDSFDLCASILPRLHCDYDILPQWALAGAAVRDGRLVVGDEDYAVLIASPHALDPDASDVVTSFVREGGKWVIPPRTRDEPTGAHIDCEIAVVRELLGEEAVTRVHILRAGTSDADSVMRELARALLDSSVPPVVEIATCDGAPAPDVRCVSREVDSRRVHFLINTSEVGISAAISLDAPGAAELWDPEDGSIRPADGPQLRDGRLHIEHQFAAYGSIFIVVDPERPVQSRPATARVREEIRVFEDAWDFQAVEPNALPLDRWDLHLRTHGAGSDYTYSTSFGCRSVPPQVSLMLDDIEYRSSLMGGMDISVRVNEHEWRRPEFGHYLDRGFKTLDIAGAVIEGRNTIELVIRHSAWSGQPHTLNSPPMLLGRFAVDESTRELLAPPVRIRSGSWTAAGYPFFSGTAGYTQSFSLPERPRGRLMVHIDSVRDTVEVLVNGERAALRLWQPWEADVTGLLRPGLNTLTLNVTNSMANLLESDPRDSGLMGRVRLVAEL